MELRDPTNVRAWLRQMKDVMTVALPFDSEH